MHTVSYSIGLAGRYRMHVGLRQQAATLPGSPFELQVSPGAAYAPATRLPPKVRSGGVVGKEWHSLTLTAADKMGNNCVSGGAPMRATSLTAGRELQTSTIDNQDGTYTLQWRSEQSGTYNMHVTIDGAHVIGSPCPLIMLAARPEVSQSYVYGDGLYEATAGKPSLIHVRCKDKYGNAALPSKEVRTRAPALA